MGYYKNIAGDRYGSLRVVSYAFSRNNSSFWNCICDCGNATIVSSHNLRSGNTKTCGCSHHNRPHMDIAGKRFGRLVAVECVGKDAHGNYLWQCKCDCGNEVVVLQPSLISGNSGSCGCYTRERAAEANTKHGKRRTRLYTIYSNMISRCENANNLVYKHYGGRGVSVCDEWRSDFGAFFDWAYANGYDENALRGQCTLDRIDVNGNYCPENCRWVAQKVQCNNRRDTLMMTYAGKTQSCSQWCEELGLSYDSVYYRKRKGLSDAEAIEGGKKNNGI